MIAVDVLPPFDEVRLDEYGALLGAEAVATLLAAFECELRARPAAIHACVRRGDRDGARREAHYFRGAALGIGALASAASAQELEEAGGASVDASLRRFEQDVDDALAMLGTLSARRPSRK